MLLNSALSYVRDGLFAHRYLDLGIHRLATRKVGLVLYVYQGFLNNQFRLDKPGHHEINVEAEGLLACCHADVCPDEVDRGGPGHIVLGV
ncbi:hypothetical protein D3C81_1774810 [compost metagenome]